MAKKAYIGVNGKARNIKKIYLGVDGKARTVKKAYVGVGGVARPCWAGSGVAYFGAIDSLTTARYRGSSVAFPTGYALFTGGSTNSQLDIYDTSLTHTIKYSGRRYWDMGATTNGTYAIFAGGNYTDTGYDDLSKYASCVNESLTSSSKELLSVARSKMGAGRVGNYAVFAGGHDSSDAVKTVDAIDQSLTRTTAPDLGYKSFKCQAANAGQSLVIARNYTIGTNNYAEVYNSSLTKGSGFNLNLPLPDGDVLNDDELVGVNFGDKAVFTRLDSVVVVDSSLTRTNLSVTLTTGREPAATSSDQFLVFAGGRNPQYAWEATNTVDVFDTSLTRTQGEPLTVGRRWMCAEKVGSYFLFAGGTTSNNYYDDTKNTVEAYLITE